VDNQTVKYLCNENVRLAAEPESSLPVVGDIFGHIKMLMTRQTNPNMDAYHKLVNQYRHLSG
jgi:hypothetical protein